MRQNKKEVKKMKISEADLFEKIEELLEDYPIIHYGLLKSAVYLRKGVSKVWKVLVLPASCGRGCGL